MRATRFSKKGMSKADRKTTNEVVVCQYRNGEARSSLVPLSAIAFDSIRTFHNLDAYPYAFEEDYDIVQWACGLAAESPAARLLLKYAIEQEWSLCFADLSGAGYDMNEESGIITLDHSGFTAVALGRSAHFRHALFCNFIRALRGVWHVGQDYDFEGTHCPDAVMLMDRTIAADIETMTILTGWELRAAGHSDLWRYILGSDEGDMAMIFTRAMEKDPAGFYDGSVLTRTFCQWYGDDARVSVCDAASLTAMDDYLQNGGRFGEASIAYTSIEGISRQPSNSAYLQGMGANIAADPYFVAMHDAINETHLFQVIYDSKVVMVEGVPFRDTSLARKIFPTGLVVAEK